MLAAKYLKPILLELGGKAPLVVLADADVDAAVDATVFGAFAHQGQICMSTERVIVEEEWPTNSPRSWRSASPPAQRRSAQGRGGARIGRRHRDGGARPIARRRRGQQGCDGTDRR